MKHDTKLGLRACVWLACCFALSIGCIALSHLFVEMIENDIPYQSRERWYKISCMVGIPILVAAAQGINNILVHGWSVFFSWLGPEDLGIIGNEIDRRRALLEKEKKK